MTNRDVAAALFISPKTVEANLARIYRKLGIHSRAIGRRTRRQLREQGGRTDRSRPRADGRRTWSREQVRDALRIVSRPADAVAADF